MFDAHVHSSFSGDSDMDAVTACEQAISRGLKGIAFTDHLDIDFPDFDVEFMIDFDVYSEYMDELKKKYAPGFIILKGLEVGIQPHVIKETDEVARSYDFDFVIGSVHIIDGMDPYKGVYYNGKSKFEAYRRYLEQVLFAVRNYDNFDVLGHLDYIIRCGCYDDRSLYYHEHADPIDEILKTLISKGKGMEINTSSYRVKPNMNTPCYDIQILKRYKELGGEIITLGSDSHSTEHIGFVFDYFSHMLTEAGFRFITHFEKRKPVFDAIKNRM